MTGFGGCEASAESGNGCGFGVGVQRVKGDVHRGVAGDHADAGVGQLDLGVHLFLPGAQDSGLGSARRSNSLSFRPFDSPSC